MYAENAKCEWFGYFPGFAYYSLLPDYFVLCAHSKPKTAIRKPKIIILRPFKPTFSVRKVRHFLPSWKPPLKQYMALTPEARGSRTGVRTEGGDYMKKTETVRTAAKRQQELSMGTYPGRFAHRSLHHVRLMSKRSRVDWSVSQQSREERHSVFG